MAIAVPTPAERGLEFAAAAIPAMATAYAGAALGPLLGFASFPAAGVLATSIFGASFVFMRMIGKVEPQFVIPTFVSSDGDFTSDHSELLLDVPVDDDALLLDGETQWPPLVLDQPCLGGQIDELAELLLTDPIPLPSPQSRVVQLFAPQPMPTAGQLADRIDRHLGHASVASKSDATDALHEALEELRRSLRRA